MNFVDQVQINVRSGNGGDGCVAFRRERFRPLGGPSGGDGGRGGSIIIKATRDLTTLVDLHYTRVYQAKNGKPGMGDDCNGASADHVVIHVPQGTLVYDAETGKLLYDLDQDGVQFVAARGGQGGRGNIHFKTSCMQAPRKTERGEQGESRTLRLELKLLADVGVVGFPNTGKSTLVSTLTRAKPKIAEYPFTTLVPTLGVVSYGENESFVIADVPGLCKGSSQGYGLGHRFLRHIERCSVLVHLTTYLPPDACDPRALIDRLDILEHEMYRYNPQLMEKPKVVVLSKVDLPEVHRLAHSIHAQLSKRHIPMVAISAITNTGLHELVGIIARLLKATQKDKNSSSTDFVC